MIVFIIFYVAGFIVTGEVALLELGFQESKTPVITSFTLAFLWPMYLVYCTWKGMKAFARHMLKEFSELR